MLVSSKYFPQRIGDHDRYVHWLIHDWKIQRLNNDIEGYTESIY